MKTSSAHAALRDAKLPGYTLLYAMKANRFARLLTSLQHTGLQGSTRVLHARSNTPSAAVSDQIRFRLPQAVFRDETSMRFARSMGFLSTVIRYTRLKLGVKLNRLVDSASALIRVWALECADNDKLQYAGVAATEIWNLRRAIAGGPELSGPLQPQDYENSLPHWLWLSDCRELPQWDRVLGACLEKFPLSGARRHHGQCWWRLRRASRCE